MQFKKEYVNTFVEINLYKRLSTQLNLVRDGGVAVAKLDG